MGLLFAFECILTIQNGILVVAAMVVMVVLSITPLEFHTAKKMCQWLVQAVPLFFTRDVLSLP